MKRIVVTLAFTLATCLRSQAPEPMPLARENTPGEPHHHLKLENEYVRVYYVEVPPHENTFLHQHDNDYLFVTLGDSDVINAVRDKPEVRLKLYDGETHFTRGGFAHIARNQADTPFRNVTIELLKRQTNPYNLCGQIQPGNVTNLDCQRISMHGRGYSIEPQFETSEIKLNLVRLDPKATDIGMIVQGRLLLTVVLNDSKIEISAKGKPAVTLDGGKMTWLPGDTNLVMSNPENKPSSFLALIMEPDSAAKP